MAELPVTKLKFDKGCPDCGERLVELPPPLPGVADGFDWTARDYDSLRLFMMQELAYRFPDRRRWTPADMEVVIVEVLAAALDRASHAIDVVQSERYLASARRPQSVRRLLKLIGYDAAKRVRDERLDSLPPSEFSVTENREQKLERLWRLRPDLMEKARAEAPRLIAEQRRMVTLADHAETMRQHPLVSRAETRLVWTGAWNTIMISVLLENARTLDEALRGPTAMPAISDRAWKTIEDFHLDQSLSLPGGSEPPTARRLLQVLIERRRMLGSEVFLENAKPAAITFTLSVRTKPGYFRSEIRQAMADIYSSDEGGFFEPGRLDFGEAAYASDLVEAAMAVDGIEVACLNRFKRVGSGWPDRAAAGFIPVESDEYIQCQNRRGDLTRGYFRLIVNGGEAG
jgi:hypothetical protein